MDAMSNLIPPHSHPMPNVATESAAGVMSPAMVKKLNGLSDEHLIRNVTLTAASFVANTDSYASFYGFCSDYAVAGMTETCKADYETEPGSDGIRSFTNLFSVLYHLNFRSLHHVLAMS